MHSAVYLGSAGLGMTASEIALGNGTNLLLTHSDVEWPLRESAALYQSTNHEINASTTQTLSIYSMGSEDKRSLIIVSNRLPLSIKRVDGQFKSSMSSGGLVTSLSGLTKSTDFRWFGWPGMEVNDPKDRENVCNSLAEHKAVPIFLDADLAHEHYNSFCSNFPFLALHVWSAYRWQTQSSGPFCTTSRALSSTTTRGMPISASTNVLLTQWPTQPQTAL